jgi:hypothetical protein
MPGDIYVLTGHVLFRSLPGNDMTTTLLLIWCKSTSYLLDTDTVLSLFDHGRSLNDLQLSTKTTKSIVTDADVRST